MDLFEYADQQEHQAPECDHLPVGQRYFTATSLVCGKCHKVLRAK